MTPPTARRATLDVSPDVAAALGALADLTDRAFELVDTIAAATLRQLELADPPHRATLAGIDSLTADLVERAADLVQGAGFVAAVGLFDDAQWWLEWFARDDGKVQRLLVQTDPQGPGFYDYQNLPWYVVARDTGHRHVTGPYVDYLCTEDYTLTFTTPLTVHDRFVGVAGCDVRVNAAEEWLLPALRKASSRLVVLNAHGRIVASNSGRHVCGDLVGELDVAAAWARPGSVPGLHQLDDLPLGVLELDR
jgi:hypothetical protein